MTTQIFTVMKKYRFRWEAEEFELTKKDLTLKLLWDIIGYY